MRTRRSVLAVLGTTVVAGCASKTTTTSSTNNEEEPEYEFSIPLDGLGKYEEKIRAVSLSDSEFSVEGLQNLIGPDGEIEDEQETLINIITTENKYEVLRAYYGAKEQSDNTLVVNQNYAFYRNSGPILELYTVENGDLQSGPVIKTVHGNIDYPGPKGPESIQDLRDPTDAAQFVSQSYKSTREQIVDGVKNNDATEKQVREFRANFLQDWSRVMFGVDDKPDVIPHDMATAEKVFTAMYGNGDAGIIATLSNTWRDADFAMDTLVTVEYTQGETQFRTPENRVMGDPLEGEKQLFS